MLVPAGCGGVVSSNANDAHADSGDTPPLDGIPSDGNSHADTESSDVGTDVAPASEAASEDVAVIPDVAAADAATIVTLTATVSGNGKIVAVGLDCGMDCAESYPTGTEVVIIAKPVLGNAFVGWSGACTNTWGNCAVSMAKAETVTASFVPISNNIVFATSTEHTGDLGGLAGADAICATRAVEAALPGTYKAWLSTRTTAAISRLGAARGWVRMDGRVFADTQQDLAAGKIVNPIMFDEKGQELAERSFAYTGTDSNGAYNDYGYAPGYDCLGWTSAASSGAGSMSGSVRGGPRAWTHSETSGLCNLRRRLICMGVDKANEVTPSRVPGKIAFVSSGVMRGDAAGAKADAACVTDAANAGLGGSFKALLSTTTMAAASRFPNVASVYVDANGQPIAAGADFFRSRGLSTGVWVRADGTYIDRDFGVWTGAATPSQLGKVSCGDWTGAIWGGEQGSAYLAGAAFFYGGYWVHCNTEARVYCVQE